MGFIDWAKLIGGGVAAPFTGGATLPIAMSGLSDVLGGAAKAGQQQNNSQDQLKLLLEQAKLNRDKFAVDAPGKRLQTSAKASMLGNFQPTKVDWGQGGFKPGAGLEGKVPTFTGGFSTPVDDRTKQLSSRIMDEELQSQLQGGPSGGNQDRAMPTGIGQSSTSDKVLGGAAMGTSVLAALLKAFGKGGGGGGNGTYYEPNDANGWG